MHYLDYAAVVARDKLLVIAFFLIVVVKAFLNSGKSTEISHKTEKVIPANMNHSQRLSIFKVAATVRSHSLLTKKVQVNMGTIHI